MEVYGKKVQSRLLLGTAQYPSPAVLKKRDLCKRHADHHGLVAQGNGQWVRNWLLGSFESLQLSLSTQHRWLP